MYLFKEYFVEMFMPVRQDKRTHGNARRLHINQEIANAVVFRRIRIGAHQHENPVRVLRAGGPDLLAIHDKIIAVIHRARLQASEIRASPRLGVSLAPDDVSAQCRLEEAIFLLLRAPDCTLRQK